MHARACKMSRIRVVGAGWERVSATARVVFIIHVCGHLSMAAKYAEGYRSISSYMFIRYNEKMTTIPKNTNVEC